MNRTQKSAWYGILLSVLLSSLFLMDAFESRIGIITTHVIGYLVLLPLLIIPVYILQKKKTEPDFDERDKSIVTKGVIISFCMLAAVVLLGYLAAFLEIWKINVPAVSKMPDSSYILSIIFIFSLSVSVLVQYGKGGQSYD